MPDEIQEAGGFRALLEALCTPLHPPAQQVPGERSKRAALPGPRLSYMPLKVQACARLEEHLRWGFGRGPQASVHHGYCPIFTAKSQPSVPNERASLQGSCFT